MAAPAPAAPLDLALPHPIPDPAAPPSAATGVPASATSDAASAPVTTSAHRATTNASSGQDAHATPVASPTPTSDAELDALARRLETPILRRVRDELLLDRERLGLRADRGWEW